MHRYLMIPAAAVIAAGMLCGCSENETEQVTAEASEETSVITTADDGYRQDIDPAAEQHSDEAQRIFFQSPTAVEKEFYPSENSVKFSGRHILYNGVQYLSYTCSSVDFIMTGDRIEADMVSNGHVYNDNQQAWIAVVIDGETVKRFRVDGGENTYILYEGDMLYNAKVSIIKLSENQSANAGIKALRINARKIAPEYKKDKLIEFIGDSLTCGYGNEGTEYDDFDTAQENGMLAYPYLTAKALNMDYSMVCISGIGIVSDYSDEVGVKEDYLLMGENYDYTDYNFQSRRGISELEEWNFGDGADIVVINLGTNDVSYTGKSNELRDEFAGEYYNFIEQVRSRNPDAEIICTLGIVGSELYEEIESAAQRFSENTSDKRVHTFQFSYMDEADGYGADYHPSVKAHEHAAEELTEFIRTEILGEEPMEEAPEE
ncbi:MAG: GDSL-type esterase/lipase family protein [Huintestinicola sp.]